MKIRLIVEIEKERTNEVNGDAWCPLAHDVAEQVGRLVVGRDLDTGWQVRSVKGAERLS